MYSGKHFIHLKIDEPKPESFVPAWAAYRGILATPRHVLTDEERKTHLGVTPYLTNLFRNGDRVALEKEFALEAIRSARYPKCNSRIYCIYAWPDENTARLAHDFWSRQGDHFSERCLVEVGFWADVTPTVVDSRWIDKFIIFTDEPLSKLGSDWVDEYWMGVPYPWNGEDDLPNEPLWECLIDGIGTIWGTELRMKGLEIVEMLAPEALGLLEIGRLGVDLCTFCGFKDEWRLGEIVPLLIRSRDNVPMIRYALNQEKKYIQSVGKAAPKNLKKEEVNWSAIELLKDIQRMPDLRPLEVKMDWLSDGTQLSASLTHMIQTQWLRMGGDISLIVQE